ncbi:hypothetical protein BGZ49_010563 [Haplosporangium sp. Z 27]|nr:hypothetical protein BGZ49_010563 [Haplosporangium sp. Z 27]
MRPGFLLMTIPQQHLKWALEKPSGKEHVFFPTFVKRFNFTDKEDAKRAYIQLIQSDFLRKERQKILLQSYSEFEKNKEETFWATYLADYKLRVTTKVTMTETAAAAQNAGAKLAKVEYSRALKELDDPKVLSDFMDGHTRSTSSRSHVQEPSNLPITSQTTRVPPERGINSATKVPDRSKVSRKRGSDSMRDDDSITSTQLPTPDPSLEATQRSSVSTKSKKISRRPSISSKVISESDFQVNKSKFMKQKYHINGVDIGQKFLDHQLKAADLVNRLSIKASRYNIHYFLAINYNFDLTANAPDGINPETFKSIKDQFSIEYDDLPEDQVALCLALGREMARTGKIIPKLYDDIPRASILHLFQSLDSEYSFGWANEVDEGSQARRKDGYKPDGYLKKMQVTLCLVEIKSPRQVRNEKDYVEDYWKLAALCKDNINLHLASGRGVRKMAAVQVFGHQLSVYTMEFDHGLYFWSLLGACFLPEDRNDGSRALPCLELLYTLEKFLDSVNIVFTTPPHDGTTVGQSSNLSPSSKRSVQATQKLAGPESWPDVKSFISIGYVSFDPVNYKASPDLVASNGFLFCGRDNGEDDGKGSDHPASHSFDYEIERKVFKNMHLDMYETVSDLPWHPVPDAIIQDGYLCWSDETNMFKCKLKCKKYKPSTVNTPLCRLDNAPDSDWVDVDKYVKSPGYGNCDHAGYLSMWNPMFANKVFIENKLAFASANVKYTQIYFDIETYNTNNYSTVPLVGSKYSKIGIISMYIPSFKILKLFCYSHYSYDIDLIKKLIGETDVEIEVQTFAHEHTMCQSFVTTVNDFAGTKLLMGFRSSVDSNTSHEKHIGYDLPFILERSHFSYFTQNKSGVKLYNNYNNKQIMTVDILPQTYVLDMSVLLYQNLTPTEHTKIERYSLDDYLALNNLGSKLNHDYSMLQPTLHVGFDDDYSISQAMAYCAYDSIALHNLNKKRDLIASRLAYIDILNVPFNFVLYQTVATQLKCHLMQQFDNAGYLCQYLAATDQEESNLVKYKGAHTQKISNDDVLQVLQDLTILDYTSQYPSIIINYNISLETLCLDNNEGDNHVIDISDDQAIEQSIVSYVKADKLGVIPTLAQRFLTERAKSKQLMKSDKQNIQQHNNRKLALKIAVNTIYELLGNPRHTLFDRTLAASVTAAGRHSIKTVRDYLETKGVETKFIDTDSVAVKLIGVAVNSKAEYIAFIRDINAHIKQTIGSQMVLDDEDILHKVIFPPKAKSYAKLTIDRDSFFAGNLDSLDLVIKGPAWSEVALDTDTDMIVVREESIIRGSVYRRYSQYHQKDLDCPVCDRIHDSNPLFAYVMGWSKLIIRCRRNRSDPNPKPDIEYDLDIEPPPKKTLVELVADIQDNLKITSDVDDMDPRRIKSNTRAIKYDIEQSFVTFVKSPLGTHKTTVLKDILNNLPEKTVVLVMSFRKTFSNNIARKIVMKNYQHSKGFIRNDDTTKLVLQIDSIGRYVATRAIDILVIDELESFITHLISFKGLKVGVMCSSNALAHIIDRHARNMGKRSKLYSGRDMYVVNSKSMGKQKIDDFSKNINASVTDIDCLVFTSSLTSEDQLYDMEIYLEARRNSLKANALPLFIKYLEADGYDISVTAPPAKSNSIADIYTPLHEILNFRSRCKNLCDNSMKGLPADWPTITSEDVNIYEKSLSDEDIVQDITDESLEFKCHIIKYCDLVNIDPLTDWMCDKSKIAHFKYAMDNHKLIKEKKRLSNIDDNGREAFINYLNTISQAVLSAKNIPTGVRNLPNRITDVKLIAKAKIADEIVLLLGSDRLHRQQKDRVRIKCYEIVDDSLEDSLEDNEEYDENNEGSEQ